MRSWSRYLTLVRLLLEPVYVRGAWVVGEPDEALSVTAQLGHLHHNVIDDGISVSQPQIPCLSTVCKLGPSLIVISPRTGGGTT